MTPGKSNGRRPLDGILVIDMTRIIAGPFCGLLLADLGAEVIKVEEPKGDATRHRGPFKDGLSLHFTTHNRNKKSITLNMRSARAKEIFAELVKVGDVVLENFRPGVMAAMGFDFERLRAIKPDIILTSISGFGQTGPYSQRAAHDSIVLAQAGIQDLNGYPDMPPVRVGVNYGDYSAGLYAAFGTMTALYHRELTGEGQWVDASLLDSSVSFLGTFFSEYIAVGTLPTRVGNANVHSAPNNTYEVKDGYVSVAAGLDSQWPSMAKAIGRPELAEDPRYKAARTRAQNRPEVDALVQDWLRDKTMAEAVRNLEAAGIACGPVNTLAQMVEDPQVKARELILEVEHPTVGKIPVPGQALKMSALPKPEPKYPPLLGEHNEDVFCGLLGHRTEELAQWKQEGVI